MTNYFQKLIDGITILKIVIREAIRNNNKQIIEKCNKNFNLMFDIYIIFKNYNYSILKSKINKFKEEFIKLCDTLNNSGLNFERYPDINEQLKKKKNNQLKGTNFIEYTVQQIDLKIQSDWNNKN